MTYDAFNLSLIERVPVCKEMIDAQIEGARCGSDCGDELTTEECRSAEFRSRVACLIAESFRGLIYNIGDQLYASAVEDEEVLRGRSFVLSEGAKFIPRVELSMLCRGTLWKVSDPDEFLKLAFDWYVRALQVCPEHFRREEWELVLTGEGELVVSLTGHVKPIPEKIVRTRATVAQYGKNDPN